MTVLSPNDRLTRLAPSAGTTTLSWDWHLPTAAGMTVVRERDGVETELTPGLDYSFAFGLGGPTGGTLQLTTASVAGDRYFLVGLGPLTRLSDFSPTQIFDTAKHNADLDHLTRNDQELRRDVDRSLKFRLGVEGFEDRLPEHEPAMLLGWDAITPKVVNIDPLTIIGNLINFDGLTGIPWVENTGVLALIPTVGLASGQVVKALSNVNGRSADWRWTPASLEVHDDGGVVRPADKNVSDAGRWHQVGKGILAGGFIGQSQLAQSDPRDVEVPTGTSPLPVAPGPHVDWFTRTAGSPNDTISHTGPVTPTPAISHYRDSGGTRGPMNGQSPFSGNNSFAAGIMTRLFEETDNAQYAVSRSLGSTPIERWLLSSKVNITGVTLGNPVVLTVDNILPFQSESVNRTLQVLRFSGVGGTTQLNAIKATAANRSPGWTAMRTTSTPTPGTIELYTEDGVTPIDGSAWGAWTSGGVVHMYHLWDAFVADSAAALPLAGKTAYDYLFIGQAEGNGGALPTDEWSTVGGNTVRWLEMADELVEQLRASGLIRETTPITFLEAARDDTNAEEKRVNIFLSRLADRDPYVSVVSSRGWPTADNTHFDAKADFGYYAVAPIINAMLDAHGSGQSHGDPYWYRTRALPSGEFGQRRSRPYTMDQAYLDMETDRFGNDWMNGQFFSCRSSRIRLPASITAAAGDFGGGFEVYVTSVTGNTPDGSGGTDATADGRTAIVKTGMTFRNIRTGVETTDIYYIDGTKRLERFLVLSATLCLVDSSASQPVGPKTWTPVLTCTTPGDLAIAGSPATAVYYYDGSTINILLDWTFTPTFTTASGDLLINGLPAVAPNTLIFASPIWHTANFGYPAGVTQLAVMPSGNVARIYGSGDGVGSTAVAITDFTSGVSVQMRWRLTFPVINA